MRLLHDWSQKKRFVYDNIWTLVYERTRSRVSDREYVSVGVLIDRVELEVAALLLQRVRDLVVAHAGVR